MGKQATIGGVAREFYQKIDQWYKKPENWKYKTKEDFVAKAKGGRIADDAFFVFEPHVAELKLNEMLAAIEVAAPKEIADEAVGQGV